MLTPLRKTFEQTERDSRETLDKPGSGLKKRVNKTRKLPDRYDSFISVRVKLPYETSYRPRNESRYPDELKYERSYESKFLVTEWDTGQV